MSRGCCCHRDPPLILPGGGLTVGKQRTGRAGGGLVGVPTEALRWERSGESRKPEELR